MTIFCSDEEEEKEEKVYNPRCRGELREWRQVNARNTYCSAVAFKAVTVVIL
jgi:hypothetical protein